MNHQQSTSISGKHYPENARGEGLLRACGTRPLACLRGGAFNRGCGLAEQDCALLRGADAAHIRIDGLRLLVGALDRGTRTDRFEPTLEVRKVGDVLAL